MNRNVPPLVHPPAIDISAPCRRPFITIYSFFHIRVQQVCVCVCF